MGLVETCQGIWTGQTIDDSVICADKAGTSICSGDSGGPLGKTNFIFHRFRKSENCFSVIQEGGEWRLIGATSWAQSFCNVNGLPQGWANIQHPSFNEWMRTNAGL